MGRSPVRTIRLASLAALLVVSPVLGGAGEKQSDLDRALTKLAGYDYGDDRKPLTAIEKAVTASLGKEKKERTVAKKLGVWLQKDSLSFAAKQFLCRQLWMVGTEEQVPILAAYLTDQKMAHMARYALQRMDNAAAGEALRAALDRVEGDLKVGVVNSIGARGDRKAVDTLIQLANAGKPAVARAAVAALGKIGGPKARKTLRARLQSDPVSEATLGAYLRCADRLLERGRKKKAATMYERLEGEDRPRRIRLAVLRGHVEARGADAVSRLLDVLRHGDAVMRSAAVQHVGRFRSDAAIRRVASRLEKLKPSTRAKVIGALAKAGNPVARPAVAKAIDSDHKAVRLSAVRALARLGDATTVGRLAKLAAQRSGKMGKAAARSLRRLPADGVDAAIVEGIRKGPAARRRVLIRAAVARRSGGAVDPLLAVAKEGDEALRAEAYKGLAKLAGPEHLSALVDRMHAEAGGPLAEAARKAVVSVARSIDSADRRVRPLVSGLADAGSAATAASLRALGKLGGEAALKAVRARTQSDDAAVREAAIRALAEWPSPRPTEDLLKIARTAEKRVHHVVALRGYIRMVGDAAEKPAGKVALYKKALDASRRPAERKRALSGLSGVPTVAALETAAERLEAPKVRSEAASATVSIAETLFAEHPAKVAKAIKKVRQRVDEGSIRKQAGRILRAVHALDRHVVRWRMAGPYQTKGKKGNALLSVAFAPDREGKAASWKAVSFDLAPSKPWKLDLKAVAGGSHRAAYLRTHAHVSEATAARLLLAHDDGARAWVNGEAVYTHAGVRGGEPSADPKVTLKKGWNSLTVKVVQGGGRWYAGVSLVGPDDEPLDALRIQRKPPE